MGGSKASFFPFPLLPNLSNHQARSLLPSKCFHLPSILKGEAWAFIWPVIGNVQHLPFLSTALSPVLQYIQEKKYQVLVEWFLIAFLSFHFNSIAVEAYESNLFVFLFRFWAYLSIDINVTSCHEATNTTSKCSWFHALCTSVSSSVPSVWLSHLLWHTSMGQFQRSAQRRHFVEKQCFRAPKNHLYFRLLSSPSNYCLSYTVYFLSIFLSVTQHTLG